MVVLVFAQAMFGGALVTTLADLNADNVGDWAALLGVSPLGGVAPDNLIDLPTGYGQIPVTVAGEELLDPVASFGFTDGTQGLRNEAAGPITMTFPLVYGVGFYIVDNLGNGYDAQIEAFDVHGTLLDTVTTSAFESPVFIGVLDSTPDIASIQVDTNDGSFNDFFSIANIHVNVSAGAASPVGAAPEPSSWLLALPALFIPAWRNKGRAREWLRRPCAATTRHSSL